MISRTDELSDRCPRSRRTMFSTPMIASSTTTPSATASPPSVMVLIVHPSASTAMTVESKASGMDAKVTATLRKSRRNMKSTRVISSAPIRTSSRTPRSAFSMKFAGRCSLGYSVTPLASSAGLSEAIASSVA